MVTKRKTKKTSTKKSSYSKSYSRSKYLTKRPMWEWIVIYIVIGLVLYAAVYFFFIYPHRVVNMPTNTTNSSLSVPGY